MIIPAVVCFGGTEDPVVDDSKYLEYGKQFHFVAKLEGVYADGVSYQASAVAINDHTLITAAHIIENNKFCIATLGNKTFAIYKFIYPKEFDRKCAGSADIAIGYSTKPFNLEFYPGLYDKADEVNKLCSISGYGVYGNFISGTTSMDGKRRAGSNIIDYAFRDVLVCTPSPIESSDRTSLEFIIASGDSGGGLFIGDKLAGINSCVLAKDKKTDSTYGDESCHTRISKFIDWIKKNQKQAP